METTNVTIDEDIVAQDTDIYAAGQPIYKHILAQNICPHTSLSGCMSCGIEGSCNIPLDDRSIAETSSRGLINCNYSLIPDEIKDSLKPGDMVIIKCEETHEVGIVREVGEIVAAKRQKMGLYGEVLPEILRLLNDEDKVTLEKNIHEEEVATNSFRKKAIKYNLNMKLVDVHFQFDRNKLFFFYTADGRVDFRELAKDLASEFKTRIELRQIGVRDEAKRVGGIGTCGREFCCSSFLGNFKRITTQLANEQNLAQSFSKLSGPCGKLKCCLSFETDKTNGEVTEIHPVL